MPPTTDRPNVENKHVAVLLADDFEDAELRVPVDRLRSAGCRVTVLGSEAGRELHGKRGKEHIRTDDAIGKRSAMEFDALLIPGGYSPDHLRLHEPAVHFIRTFADTERPIAAVCHGPQLLISAGLTRDRRMTSWPSVRIDLENAGARWVDEEVVIDHPFITSRKPDDLEAFSTALIQAMAEDTGGAVA